MIIQSEHGYYIIHDNGSRDGPYGQSNNEKVLDEQNIEELYQEYGNPVG